MSVSKKPFGATFKAFNICLCSAKENFADDTTTIIMKPALLLVVVATAVSGKLICHPGAREQCGRLGPMCFDPDTLPEGVDPGQVRMCAEHPNGAANWWGVGKYLPHWVPGPPWIKLTDCPEDERYPGKEAVEEADEL